MRYRFVFKRSFNIVAEGFIESIPDAMGPPHDPYIHTQFTAEEQQTAKEQQIAKWLLESERSVNSSGPLRLHIEEVPNDEC